ncbi:hypothetical protein [Paracoccus hibiscisoli]|uniref:DUF1983 domain-containing protein n=1 Tax=Paracoccus hibiscisoli TaxID=2023261 RepID=A0A4U0RCF1_9RHOB|nr:hypothetical protein [Paracoccus hibiscisoli]TJZ85834.1 hypothetical protein FA740_05385 [Paracoccus hibiscisoli]
MAKRAVRFSDLKNGLAGVGGGFDAAAVKRIAETVAREVAEGYDGANVDLGQLQADIDAAAAEAAAARAEVINAVSAANDAQAYADALVNAVRSDLAADFTQAQEAATVAAQQIQTAADAVLAEAVRVQDWSAEAQVGATQAQAARDLAVIARQGAQGHEAAAELAAGVAATARDQAGAQADAAATSRTQAAGFASDSSASAIASEQSRLAADAARGGAENAEAGAQAARDTSVSAKNDAEGASSQAQTSANLAAQSRTDAAGFADAAGTARTQAQNSASAAAGSASTAATQATNAGSSATAANSSRIAAEAARDGANAANASAGINRDQAVTARQNAETAAAGAQESLRLTAEVSGRDMSVINDTFLQSSDWIRWNSGGSLLNLPNSVYPIGRDWRFTVGATQDDGMAIIGSPPTIWTGQLNADAYAIEVEFTLNSGTLTGAGIGLWWINTAGTEWAPRLNLADMVSGPRTNAQTTQTARGIIVRPAGFTGTLASHRLYAFANWIGLGLRAAKTITFHRIRIRPATAEELGRGEVAAGVQANLLVNYLTSAQTNQAVADLEERLTAAMGGSLAAVRRSATAIANLSGSVARIVNIATVNGQPVGAGIEAVAFNNTGGSSGTLLKLVGDNVVAKGTLSASALVVGLGKNLIPDPQFLNGLQDIGQFVGGGQTATFGLRKAPQTWGGAQYPSLEIFQGNTFSGGFADAVFRPVQNEAGDGGFIPCEGNAWYMASGKVSNHRANGQLIFSWFTADGTPISSVNSPQFDYGSQSSTNPETWQRAQFLARAPANAALMRVHFRKLGTKSGTNSFMFIYKPQVEETHEDATAPTAWDAGGSTYINGSRMITDTFDATRLIRTPDIRAIMGRFGSLTAANISVGVGEVGTIMLNGNAVTVGAGQELGNFVPGNGAWQVANSVSYTLPFSGAVTIQWFASQNYLVRQSQAIGIRLRINGTVQWSRIAGDPNGGATIEQDWLVMGWRRLLGAGTHNIVVDWWSNNANLRLETRSLMINGAMR